MEEVKKKEKTENEIKKEYLLGFQKIRLVEIRVRDRKSRKKYGWKE